jgi:hypothetical protein
MSLGGQRLVTRLATLAAVAMAPRAAHAAPPSPELMAKLAEQAEVFERMRNHASFTISAELRELDDDGTTTSTKTGLARIEADGQATHTVVIRYAEDGKDKKADGQKEAREADEKRAHRTDAETLHMPFLPRERDKYVFDEVEHDPANPTRVRITFVPKPSATGRTLEGSAWVDETAGRAVSAGFKMNKTPMFVDFVHVTVEFGAETALGPATSRVTIDGGGGFWFFHKHVVATATLTDYRIMP